MVQQLIRSDILILVLAPKLACPYLLKYVLTKYLTSLLPRSGQVYTWKPTCPVYVTMRPRDSKPNNAKWLTTHIYRRRLNLVAILSNLPSSSSLAPSTIFYLNRPSFPFIVDIP